LRSIVKKLGRNNFVRGIVAAIIAGAIQLVKSTTRWRTANNATAENAWSGRTPVIVVFWHNRLAMMPVCWPSSEPFHMLISAHSDGQLIARAVAYFGIQTIPGSSTRGGGEALRALVRKLKSGESVGITPDGPRGPRMRASDGAITLARLSGVSILPASISVSRRKVLSTWDQLIVPMPFGRGAMVWGDPIAVPRDANDEMLAQLRGQLEAALNKVSAEVDDLAGHAPMTPADIALSAKESADART
jgi:lysophospholipid acyltransferase (LPLAT)-like uncharacterized protein